jgi:ribosomal protein L24
MQLPHWASRVSWKQGDRVIVAIGAHKGRHGTVYLRAEKSNYLVLLDGETRARKFQKGALDPE